jgi:predicted RNase H-like nuclease (RuvC/YqgF family)
MPNKVMRPCGALLALSLVAAAASGQAFANPMVKTTLAEQSATENSARQAQQRINELDDRTRDAVSEYRSTLQEIDSLKRYNEQLALQVESQAEEMKSIQQQIVQIERTSREITPLLVKMVDTLDKFVALDVPFLPEERKTRVQQLKEMMARADVTLSEKYRRVMEAWQVEVEYGRTIEAYQGKVGEKTVDFLRVGRVVLMYQGLDGKETAYWDAGTNEWVIDSDYRHYVKAGLKVARKQGAPDLLIAPVPAPQPVTLKEKS